MRDLSQLVIAYESKGNKSAGTALPAAFLVSDKLRPHLAMLMGEVGFRALLSRALVLATAEAACLRPVQVGPDGSLEGLEELQTHLTPEESEESSVVLVAQLLGLLGALIGEKLTFQIVREMWPKLATSDLGLRKGDKNEKEK
jgi:hypothetical protein